MTNFVRKFLEEFAKDNKNTDLTIFGSTGAGSPSNSADPEVLQSNSKFKKGWAGATLLNAGNLTRNPVQNEWSALNYIHNYQINHILQKGLQEYNTLTEYFIGDMVREIGGLKLYQSLTDNNTGNALSDTVNWQLSSGLEATNIVVINSINDFPAAVAGVITLENGKQYLFNTTIVTSNRFVIPTSARVTLTSVDLGHALVYTGSDTLFTASDFGSFITEKLFVVGSATCTFFDFDNAGDVFLLNSIFTTCAKIGNIKCGSFATVFSAFSVYGDGIVFDDRTDTVKRSRIVLNGLGFSLGLNNSITIIDFKGNLDAILIRDGGVIAGSNETVFDFDQSLEVNNVVIELQGFAAPLPFTGNAFFAPSSLKQDYINALFVGNTGVSDSETIGSLAWVSNTTDTVISTQDVYVKLAGTTFAIKNERCSQTDNNELTFTNVQSISKTLICRFDVIRGSGSGTPTFEFRILKNGSPIQINSLDVTSKVVTNSSDSVNMALAIPIDVVTGDIFVVEGKNITNTSNVLITDGTVIIN